MFIGRIIKFLLILLLMNISDYQNKLNSLYSFKKLIYIKYIWKYKKI